MGLIYTSYRGRGEEIGRELPRIRDYYNTTKGYGYGISWYGMVCIGIGWGYTPPIWGSLIYMRLPALDSLR